MNTNPIAFQKELSGDLETAISKVTESLKAAGFGVLTRIDFHLKIKEKTGHTIPPTVILGACKPQLAYEAYQKTTDTTLLVPCNVVLREVEKGRLMVEAAKPSAILTSIMKTQDAALDQLVKRADQELQQAIQSTH